MYRVHLHIRATSQVSSRNMYHDKVFVAAYYEEPTAEQVENDFRIWMPNQTLYKLWHWWGEYV